MNTDIAFSKEFIVDGLLQAPTGIAIFTVPGYTVKMANPFYLQMVDRTEDDMIGRPLFEVMPEVATVVTPLFNQVIESGTPYYGNEVATALKRHGRIETSYFNLVYQPLRNFAGAIEGIMVVANEVTELVLAKKQQQESEEKFRQVVSQSPIPIAILRGREFNIELANASILKMIWQRTLSEVEGRKLMEVFPELEGQPFPHLLRKVYDTGIAHSEKEMQVYIEGSTCSYVDFEYTPQFTHDNVVSGIMVTVYDVTEKVRTRIRTEENEARLRMVVEASRLGTWELNLQTGAFSYSDEYLATFGVTERLSHEQLLEFMHPDDQPIRRKALDMAFKTGWLHYVSRLIWRDKTVHWIEAHGKVLYDPEQQPLKLIGTSRDITEERRFSQSLQESEQKFRLLADSMPQIIWTGDGAGNLNYFNHSVFDFSGLTFDELKGQGWLQIVHPDDRAMNIRKWLEAVRSGKDFLFEHRFRKHDGSYRWQLSRAIPQHDEQGNIQMWVGTSTDIDDQKSFARALEEKVAERTRELRQMNDQLEKTNRELEQFAYVASHDLQEPLRKIQTFSNILKTNFHEEAFVKRYFHKIESSAQRMADLIRSVLDYSRLTTSHQDHFVLTDLNVLLSNVKIDLELVIADKGAQIVSDNLPAVEGIPLQLNQLFSNLISNALKFCIGSPRLEITHKIIPGAELTATFMADPEKKYVAVFFKDNGIGFEKRFTEQIFTIFQRLHGPHQYSGTGIGLALCKKIVENHRGFITANSELTKGSTFEVYLPL